MLPESIEHLAEQFRAFPGIGFRSSQKLAIDLLEMKNEDYEEFVQTLQKVKQQVKFCSRCGFFAQSDPAANDQSILCQICTSTARNKKQICLVESPTDVITMERSQSYFGTYHVLQKLISPLDNVFPQDTNLSSLLEERIPQVLSKQQSPTHIELELILFFKAGFDSEATSAYIQEVIKDKAYAEQILITRLAQGLPLYYNPDTLDQATMKKALEDRREI